jgi:hypothetical protein
MHVREIFALTLAADVSNWTMSTTGGDVFARCNSIDGTQWDFEFVHFLNLSSETSGAEQIESFCVRTAAQKPTRLMNSLIEDVSSLMNVTEM